MSLIKLYETRTSSHKPACKEEVAKMMRDEGKNIQKNSKISLMQSAADRNEKRGIFYDEAILEMLTKCDKKFQSLDKEIDIDLVHEIIRKVGKCNRGIIPKNSIAAHLQSLADRNRYWKEKNIDMRSMIKLKPMNKKEKEVFEKNYDGGVLCYALNNKKMKKMKKHKHRHAYSRYEIEHLLDLDMDKILQAKSIDNESPLRRSPDTIRTAFSCDQYDGMMKMKPEIEAALFLRTGNLKTRSSFYNHEGENHMHLFKGAEGHSNPYISHHITPYQEKRIHYHFSRIHNK